MRNCLALLVALFLLDGCKRPSGPVSLPPAESELLGTWRLNNSPRGRAGGPELPQSTASTLLLATNGIAKLNGVLVEELTFRDGKTPLTQWRQRTGEGSWKVDQWLRQNDASLWRVRIDLGGSQEMHLQIDRKRNGRLVLLYRPDPEMAEPFVFTRTAGAGRE